MKQTQVEIVRNKETLEQQRNGDKEGATQTNLSRFLAFIERHKVDGVFIVASKVRNCQCPLSLHLMQAANQDKVRKTVKEVAEALCKQVEGVRVDNSCFTTVAKCKTFG